MLHGVSSPGVYGKNLHFLIFNINTFVSLVSFVLKMDEV
jgi:hypothetical protein